MKEKIQGKKMIKEMGTIVAGMLLVSAAVYFFMVPSKIVVGSISGFGMVLAQLSNIPLSYITFVLNAVLLVIGFVFLGKDFGAKTVFTSMLLPFFLWIFEHIFPIQQSLTNNIVIDLACYILVVAMGQALLFHVNASSGGLDVVAKMINKFTHIEIGKAFTIAGLATAVSSLLVYDVATLIISVLGTYANGLAVDYFSDGLKKRKRVCIISEEYGEIQEYIMKELNRGITRYVAQGAYDKIERTELVTILTQHEYRLLIHYLHETKKKAFVTVSVVNEVIGNWKE